MGYWHPLGAKTAATRSLQQPENDRQRSINNFRSCIFRIRAHRRTIHQLDRQKCNISKEKHWFENHRYRNVPNMQKQSIGFWIHDFDKPLLSICKIKSLIWIYRWTHWANPLRTRPIRPSCAISIKPYPSWRLGCIGNPAHQFGDGSVSIRTRTRCDSLESLWKRFVNDVLISLGLEYEWVYETVVTEGDYA